MTRVTKIKDRWTVYFEELLNVENEDLQKNSMFKGMGQHLTEKQANAAKKNGRFMDTEEIPILGRAGKEIIHHSF